LKNGDDNVIVHFKKTQRLNYSAFQSFDFERTWWRLFQKCVMHTRFDIYVFVAYRYI